MSTSSNPLIVGLGPIAAEIVAPILGSGFTYIENPTPQDLAIATPAQVITAWGRLGYPRRALRLHAAAQIIVKDFNNMIPEDQETLQVHQKNVAHVLVKLCICYLKENTRWLLQT